ncbi:MAG: hypothetical protein RBR58_03230 [Candidatus Humimicrobiaceae bacterium]|jgi:hypothetical protein|nr:hypothetical protein [Candidatus Humimicrobiaceae bacterium]
MVLLNISGKLYINNIINKPGQFPLTKYYSINNICMIALKIIFVVIYLQSINEEIDEEIDIIDFIIEIWK